MASFGTGLGGVVAEVVLLRLRRLQSLASPPRPGALDAGLHDGVGAAEVATGPERLPPEAEHTDNACSLQAPDSDKGAPSSDPWAPRMHYTVDVAPSKRTACHECGRAFNSGAERKHNAHMHPVPCETGVYPRFSHRRAARCARLHLHRVRQRYVCSKTRWFHVDHCDVPPDGWCSVQGYDLLEPTARRCAAPETWICDPPRPALYVRLWGVLQGPRGTHAIRILLDNVVALGTSSSSRTTTQDRRPALQPQAHEEPGAALCERLQTCCPCRR